MKNNVLSLNEYETHLVPPQNPEELRPLIDNIKDEKLRKAISNLIFQN